MLDTSTPVEHATPFAPVTWRDGADPAINAVNLQRYEDALDSLLGKDSDSEWYDSNAIIPDHETRIGSAEGKIATNERKIQDIENWKNIELIFNCGSAANLKS